MITCANCGFDLSKFVRHICPSRRYWNALNEKKEQIMHCQDCGQKQHKDGCAQNRPGPRTRNRFVNPLAANEPFDDFSRADAVRYTAGGWEQPRRAATPWAVYTKIDDVAALISIHSAGDDAIRTAGGDETYQIAQLPYGMKFEDAIEMWERNYRTRSQDEEKRAELRSFLEDRGYSEEKIQELVYASDDNLDH